MWDSFFLCLSSNTSKVLSAFQKNKIKREGKKALKKSRFCLSLSLSRERAPKKSSAVFVCVCVCVCSNEEKTQRDDDGKRGGGGGEEDQENEEESEAMGDVLERGVDDGRDVLRRLR